MDWMIGLLLAFFGVFCIGKCAEPVYTIHPPTLDIDEDFIDIQSNSTLVINCFGKYPLSWETPPKTGPPENDTRLNIISSENILETVYKHKSTLLLKNADFLDTGFYKCYYEATTNFDDPSNVAPLYVFVNDPVHLFVDKPLRGFYALQQSKRSVIPCRPTSSRVNVTLWNVENEPDEMVPLEPFVMSFDPKFGFIIDYPVYEMGGDRQCRAVYGGFEDTFDLTLRFYVDSDPPQPFINTSKAQHPVVNSTFILKCTVEVELDTAILGYHWYYPNKHISEGRINETKAVVGWKMRNGNRYQEISKSLIVKDARSSDSGTYICMVTDHANQTGKYNVSIYVYETQQPAHVNFTTDIDTSKPIETEAGQDVKFVITVRAYPSVHDVIFRWEKDGKPLRNDNRHRFNKTNTSRTLEIRHIDRQDAGRYTLHGETVDRNSSISIDLLVKVEPLVSVHHDQMVYMLGQEYTLDCRAEGFPNPAVRWRWKSCPPGDLRCNPKELSGWKDVDDVRSSNRENVTFEESFEAFFPFTSSMHLVANQSVFYKCIASNDIGVQHKIIPFVVTDAVDGFEMIVSDKRPVDKDYVELICKVNTYNFTRIEWTWRPMHSVREVIPLQNTSDVTIYAISSAYSHVSVISFNPIRLNLSGEYDCRAVSLKNNYTEVKHITIDVREIRKPVLNNTNMVGGTYRTFPGTRQEFYCKTDGVPFPVISWKKDGQDLNLTSNPEFEITERNQMLTIRRVFEKDEGFYQCVVDNRGGVIYGNATLDIITEWVIQTSNPEFEITEKNQMLNIRRVFEKDEGFYQCVVDNRGGVIYGNATLDIITEWVIQTSNPEFEITEKNQMLNIRRVFEKDEGFYQCVVDNRGGVIYGNATLDIITDEKGVIALTPGETSAIVIVGFALLALILLITCLVKKIMKEKREQKELDIICQNNFERGYIDVFNPNLPLDSQPELLPYKNSYEFPKERLKLDKTLGQGAFGRVVKAEAIGLVDGEASTTVAVKMLKEAADAEQKKALIAELKILIHIGRHVNIVNLLGAVTKNLRKGELYVIVEYCCYGNLRHFLLKHKEYFIDQLDHRTGQLDPQISTLPGSPVVNIQDNMITYSDILGMGMDNPTYRVQSLNYADLAHQVTTNDSSTGMSVFTHPSSGSSSERYLRHSVPVSFVGEGHETWNEETRKNFFITTCDLLCFAFQCARGMEYLASRKLIHRDLAARNVLLAADNVVKICDFGLAKDIYKYSNYKNTKGGLLPVKWMAIESIRDRVFTTKSDVWSFGVLLWELFTLGSNPYPGVEINEEFFKKLKNGYRMEKPEMAPDQIDQLMRNCWQSNPVHRPDFSQLAETIGSLLESGVRKYYVELNTPYQMMNEELFPNNNDYLQMTGDTKEEYTNMVNLQEPKGVQNTYDNIMSSRLAPTEAVPMVQLENLSSEKRPNKNKLSSEASYDEDSQNVTNITYLNVASSPESDEYDSVFLEKKMQDRVHYENGDCTSVPLLTHRRLPGNDDLHD